MPNFEENLLLLMNYLPHQKMCLYPPRYVLKGPFCHSPWRELGKAISSRQVNLKSPLFLNIYYSQQNKISLRTGFFGPSYWT